MLRRIPRAVRQLTNISQQTRFDPTVDKLTFPKPRSTPQWTTVTGSNLKLLIESVRVITRAELQNIFSRLYGM